MFGLFGPRCPIGTLEKTWTESRMCWLADRLGIDRLLKADVLIPTVECFPAPYRGTEEDVSARVGLVVWSHGRQTSKAHA